MYIVTIFIIIITRRRRMGRITRTGAIVNFRYSIKVKKCGTRTSDGGLSSRLTHCPELVDRRTRQLTPPQREMWQVIGHSGCYHGGQLTVPATWPGCPDSGHTAIEQSNRFSGGLFLSRLLRRPPDSRHCSYYEPLKFKIRYTNIP